MTRRAGDRLRHAALRRMAPVWAVLVLAAGIVGVAAYDADRRADAQRAEIAANRRVALEACERLNATHAVLVRFLAEARATRKADGALTPYRADFYRRAIDALAPIDCAALPREGET